MTCKDSEFELFHTKLFFPIFFSDRICSVWGLHFGPIFKACKQVNHVVIEFKVSWISVSYIYTVYFSCEIKFYFPNCTQFHGGTLSSHIVYVVCLPLLTVACLALMQRLLVVHVFSCVEHTEWGYLQCIDYAPWFL